MAAMAAHLSAAFPRILNQFPNSVSELHIPSRSGGGWPDLEDIFFRDDQTLGIPRGRLPPTQVFSSEFGFREGPGFERSWKRRSRCLC